MSAPELIAIAERQSLISPAALLAKVGGSSMFAPAFEADNALAMPIDPNTPLPDLFAHIARRGFAPALVRPAMDRLADRPIARGLFAWDVLVGSILAHDEIELIDELCSAALKIKQWLPPPGVSCLDLDSSRSRSLVEGPIAPVGILPFSQLLLRARAFSFASVYLHHAATALEIESARPWACEAYLESQQGSRIPNDLLPSSDSRATASALDLAEYVHYRANIEAGNIFSAFQALNATNALRQLAPHTSSVRLRLVANEIAIRFPSSKWPHEPFGWLDDQSQAEPAWAYAGRQRALTASVEDRDPLSRVGEYVMHFGNDVRVWSHSWRAAGAGAPWRVASGRLLARELAALPHEPAVWSALAIAAGDGTELASINEEIRVRLQRQSAL